MLDTIHLPRSIVLLLCAREAGPEAVHQWTPLRLSGACDPREALEEDKRQEEKETRVRIHPLPCCGAPSTVSFCQRSQPLTQPSLHQLQQGFSAVFFFSIIILLRRLFKYFSPNPFLSSLIIETVIPQIHCRYVSTCCVCVCAS